MQAILRSIFTLLNKFVIELYLKKNTFLLDLYQYLVMYTEYDT